MRRVARIAVLAALALAGCSKDEPTAPTTFAITGRVLLSGSEVDDDARFLRTRTVLDADGVPVELLYGNQVVATTTTVDGVYRFANLAPGAYRTRAQVGAALSDRSATLTIASRDVHVADTLALRSAGDLYPSPNPVVDTTTIFFDVAVPMRVDLRIVDLGGQTVREIVDANLPPGTTIVEWDARTDSGAPANASYYWLLFAAPAEGDFRAHLLFR